MTERIEWGAPVLDDVAVIRQRILRHLDTDSRRQPEFATAVTEILANAAEAVRDAPESGRVEIEITGAHLTVTNTADAAVRTPLDVTAHDRTHGRGLAFIAALWPPTDWSFHDGLVTATMELPPRENS